MDTELILENYDNEKANYESYAISLERLLCELLSSQNMKVHSITSRVKDRKSLAEKIESKDSYSCLTDITDIAGVRIITHYADDVDLIAKIIEKEFKIDKLNTIDKRKSLDPDRFGYLSLHYIVSLNSERSLLAEYTKTKELKAELQIRSILQHTWAEIEHDIGYKAGIGIPDEIKRQFSRLAGLLEIGDSEFINIRNELVKYQKNVGKKISANNTAVSINKISLTEYMKSSEIISKIKSQVKEKYKISFSMNYQNRMDFVLNNLSYVDLTSINDLDKSMREKKDMIVKKCGVIVNRRKGFNAKKPIPIGLIFVYLTQSLVVAKDNKELVRDYVSKFRIKSDDHEEFTEELIRTFS